MKHQENIKMTLKISHFPSYARSLMGAQKCMEISIDQNCISCAFYYDFKEEPLCLHAPCSVGDSVEIILTECRIELHVNGKIHDEEWPMGVRHFSLDTEVDTDCDFKAESYQVQEKPFESKCFLGGEGWKPEGEVFVGDCMPYVRGNEYHVLYLKDRHHHKSKWGLGAHQWEHIATADFKTWKTHPTAISITKPIEGSICTGSYIEKEGKQYLFYTVRMADGSPAPISRSVSFDGENFHKDESFGFFLSARYDRKGARDPKVFLGEDGLYHMLLTTKLLLENKGCIAHLTSPDLEKWTELSDPILVCGDDRYPECPDYICYGGYYYLIYSLDIRAYYLKSSRPFDGWEVPSNAQIPCGHVPKGALFGGKIVFTGFKKKEGMHGYAGVMTFCTAHADKDGWLVFEKTE